jgi:hypothetical protein
MPDLATWRKALAGEAPLHENDPQPGYWRLRQGRGGPFLPVAIWREPDGTLKALRDGAPADAQELWTWCCTNPVSYETYVAVAERGEAWPDDVPAGPGHNSRSVDPAGAMLEEILALQSSAEDWLAVASPIAHAVEADRAANFAERFAQLERQAEEARTLAKKPVLEAGRAIDAAWRPVIEAAGLGKKRLKKALEPYLLAEQHRLATLQQESEGAAAPASPRVGTLGRRVGLRTLRRLQVRDREALIKAYRRDPRFWAHAGVDAVLIDLAEADLKAGRKVSGAEWIDEQVAA